MSILKNPILVVSLLVAFFAAPSFADQDPIPHLDHVFLIIMENHSYNQILDNPDAPFINQLAHAANLASNYFAVGHPSLTNYLEVIGGSNFGIVNDNYPNWHNATPSAQLNNPVSGTGLDLPTPARIAPFGRAIAAAPYVAKTIADQLTTAGKSWRSYNESLPDSGLMDGVNFSDGIYSNLSLATNTAADYVQRLYDVKHNPFVYFAAVQASSNANNGLHNIHAFTGDNGLYADLHSGKIADFSFIVPNKCHDMHGIDNGSQACKKDAALLQMGDASVRQLVAAIKASPSWQTGNNAIIVMWDENNYADSPNQVVVIVDTSYGVHGIVSNQPYSHFALLKTLEAGFDLPCLNHACDGNVRLMADMFGKN